MNNTITREHLAVAQRSLYADGLLDMHFPLQLEPTIFNLASQLSADYRCGYWEFYRLSNGACYMALDVKGDFVISCQNGFYGNLSPEALGITVCLYAYSHLAFAAAGDIVETYAEQNHLLRE